MHTLLVLPRWGKSHTHLGFAYSMCGLQWQVGKGTWANAPLVSGRPEVKWGNWAVLTEICVRYRAVGGGWLFFWDKKMCLDYKVLYQHPFLKFCFILETWVLILLLPEVWTFRAKSLCNQATWFHLEQKDFSITFSGHKLVIILLGSTNIITFKVSIFPQSQFLCSLPGMSFSLMLFFSASSSLQERMWEASSSCSFHSFTPHPENRKGCRFSWAMPRCRRQNRLKKF